MINQIFPFIDAVFDAFCRMGGVVVAEILHQRLNDLLMVAAGGLRRVLHTDRLATVAHERGYSFVLNLSGVAFVAVSHIIPVEGYWRERVEFPYLLLVFVGGCLTVCGNLLTSTLRPLVEVHHLSHRSGHTACNTLFPLPVRIRTIIKRTLVPIGFGLIPAGLDEWLDGCLLSTSMLAEFIHTINEVICVAECGHCFVVLLQPIAHVVGHLVPVDVTIIGIS